MRTPIRQNYHATICASYLGYVTQAIVNNFAPLLFVTFAAVFGLSVEQITLLTTVNFLVQLCVDLISARVVDRIGYRPCIVAAHVFAAAGLVGLALLPHVLPAYTGLMISVVLYGSGPRGIWADTIKMMDYGFSQYTSVTPIDLYNMNPITIETSNYSLQDSNMGKLALTCRPVNPADAVRANIVATFAEVKAMASNLKKTVIISYVRDFEAPFTAGEVVGTMTFFPDGGEPVEYHLVASRSIGARENAPPSLQEIIDSVMNDPNPLPKLNSRILVSYVVIPIVLIWIIMHFISKLWSMRRHRTSRTPKVVHRHLK